jgi:hypothetical protein
MFSRFRSRIHINYVKTSSIEMIFNLFEIGTSDLEDRKATVIVANVEKSTN